MLSRNSIRRIALLLALCAVPLASAQDDAFFRNEVRPILQANCYECHGSEEIKGGLTIISRAALVEGGDQGPAIDLDHPADSLLLAMISYMDYNHQMPPDGKLDDATAATLRKWVEAGAPWPKDAEFELTAEVEQSDQEHIWAAGEKHWAYQPLSRPEAPDNADTGWAANPIDAFIRHGLDERGFTPADEASRATLIRRAYYDLIGLPPLPEEVAAFVNDESPNAWEAVIDRLLASPHYGEKWGRHWLDAVRYADSNGYERDTNKPDMWRYRDYVIESFNEDKPFDRFIVEQLAGDELDEVTPESIVATGYNRLSIWNDEPDDPLLARYDYLDDVANTTAQVLLGMTMGCARCHDHKIDPIPASDYYGFVAFFDNMTLPRRGEDQHISRSIFTPAEQAEYEDKMRAKRDRINTAVRKLAVFEKRVRDRMPTVSDASDLVELEYEFFRDTWDVLPDFDLLRPENTGEIANNFMTLSVATRDRAMGLVFSGKINVPADGEYTFFVKARGGVLLRVDGEAVVDRPKRGEYHAEGQVKLKAGLTPFRLDFFNKTGNPELAVAWSGADFTMRPLTADGRGVDAVDFETLVKNVGGDVLADGEREEYEQLKRAIDEARKVDVPAKWAASVAERGNEASQAHVLIRGNPHVEGDPVTPRFPSILNPPEPRLPEPGAYEDTTGRRRVLAEWIASGTNPLTARVLANRMWQHHFGRGIVRSSNDFGLQGVAPTHPDLLDWLAAELIANDWQLKPLHKQIMLSKAYRMSSRTDETALAKDPTNESFWRFDMRRLAAEEIRDSVLNLSGDLDLAMGGPGIYTTLPEAVLATSSMAKAMWFESPKDEQGRRSIYIHVKRSILTPMLTDFDFADTDSSCPVRFSTVQPTQALNTLNSAFMNEQAEQLADRLREEAGPGRRDQVRLAFSLATSRKPAEAEVDKAIAMMDELEAAGTPHERVLDRFALLVLNLNEFIYVD